MRPKGEPDTSAALRREERRMSLREKRLVWAAGAMALAGAVLAAVRPWGCALRLAAARTGGAGPGLAAAGPSGGPDARWRWVRRTFALCLAAVAAALAVIEAAVIARGRSDLSALPAKAVIVLGAGVNGTQPSLSLRTRLDAALAYLERWPEVPVVLTGGQGYGERISEAQCMYDYLTARGVDPRGSF